MPASSASDLSLQNVGGAQAREPMVTNPSAESVSPSRIYPIRLNCCCPCLPTGLTVIQDWLHLTLLVGVVASVAVVVQMVVTLAVGADCSSFACFNRWIAAVCIIPSMIYFIMTIGSYDENLKQKKREHKQEVENLIQNINDHVGELNDYRLKVTENANDFASGYFNSQALQFQKFLKNLKMNYADRYLGEEEAVDELKKYILHWFNTFKQTLINPDTNPLFMGLERDLANARTIQEIVDKAVERLDSVKIGFATQTPASQPLIPTGSSQSSTDLESGDIKCGITWCRCGSVGFHLIRDRTNMNCMPVTINAGCVMLKILSRSHCNLMLAFLVDILLLIFEICNERWWSTALVIINGVCVMALLACFEQINEIAILEQQIGVYRERNGSVEKERDKAKNEWEQVQQLHDLWKYRTYPSLSILGKVHQHLTDIDTGITPMPSDGRAGFLSLANQCYHSMDLGLGDVKQWTTSGPLHEQWKQSIGKQIKNLEQMQDVTEILPLLPIVTKDLSVLDAHPPSSPSPSGPPSGRSSPSGSFARSPSASFS